VRVLDRTTNSPIVEPGPAGQSHTPESPGLCYVHEGNTGRVCGELFPVLWLSPAAGQTPLAIRRWSAMAPASEYLTMPKSTVAAVVTLNTESMLNWDSGTRSNVSGSVEGGLESLEEPEPPQVLRTV
jgi:hypothetical protein